MKKTYSLFLWSCLVTIGAIAFWNNLNSLNWALELPANSWGTIKTEPVLCTPWGEKSKWSSFENIRSTYCENRNIPTLVEIQSINNGQAWNWENFFYYADYPILTWSTIGKTIAWDIRKQIQDSEKWLEKFSSQTISYLVPEFYGGFKIFSSSGTTSIVYETNEYSRGANAENHISTYVIDAQWKRIDFDDLFENRKLFEQDLQIRLESDTRVHSIEDAQRGLQDFYKNPAFFLNDDRIILVFERYLIAPGSAGNIMIDFPRESEKKYFKTHIQHIEKKEFSPNPEIKEKDTSPQAVKNNTGKKYVALTFDDGPSKTQTPRLLEILKKHNVHATFYILGKNASFFPDIVKATHEAGHEIGSHTWNHPQLTRLSIEDIKAQRDDTDNILRNITWEIPKTFRPPYGAQNKEILKLFNRPSIMWSIDPQDWKYKNVSHNISAATSPASNGAIILFHDIHKASVDSIDAVIKKYKTLWYEFLTISELLQQTGKDPSAIQTCYSAYNCK